MFFASKEVDKYGGIGSLALTRARSPSGALRERAKSPGVFTVFLANFFYGLSDRSKMQDARKSLILTRQYRKWRGYIVFLTRCYLSTIVFLGLV